MKRSTLRAFGAVATVAAGLLASGIAGATPPARVVGSWTILIDNTYTTLNIDSQGGPGAPGAAQCRSIFGSFDVAPIRGIYCPDSGYIHILHNNASTGTTVRTFTGQVSEDATLGTTHMAGFVNVLVSAFGTLGPYPFSANK